MKRNLITILIIILLVPLSAVGQGEFSSREDGFNVFEKRGIVLKWKIEGDSLNIILSAATEGWIAMAFDPAFMMKNSDMIIAYIKDGEVHIRDDYAKTAFSHSSDVELGGTDGISLIGGEEKDGLTTVHFARSLFSNDRFDFNLVPKEEITIMLAYGKTDDFETIHKEAFKQRIVF